MFAKREDADAIASETLIASAGLLVWLILQAVLEPVSSELVKAAPHGRLPSLQEPTAAGHC